jgi:hypothetical protein
MADFESIAAATAAGYVYATSTTSPNANSSAAVQRVARLERLIAGPAGSAHLQIRGFGIASTISAAATAALADVNHHRAVLAARSISLQED